MVSETMLVSNDRHRAWYKCMPTHDVIEHRQGENEIEKIYTKSTAEIDCGEKEEILDKTVLKTADTVKQYEIIFKL